MCTVEAKDYGKYILLLSRNAPHHCGDIHPVIHEYHKLCIKPRNHLTRTIIIIIRTKNIQNVVPESALEAISGSPKFSVGACPQTSLENACICTLVSCPDPIPKGGKGSVNLDRFLGLAGSVGACQHGSGETNLRSDWSTVMGAWADDSNFI